LAYKIRIYTDMAHISNNMFPGAITLMLLVQFRLF